MKKIYFLLFSILTLMCYAQPYSSLLKNASWTIMKIQWNGTDYYPPSPFTQSGKVAFNFDENNGFKSTFFNTASGKVTFGESNSKYFTLQNIGVTLVEYHGENEILVQQFDAMTTSFYFGYQPTDHFNFDYQEIFSGKNLTVTNPLGYKIFYSNLILRNTETPLNKEILIYPNPAKDEFFIKSPKNTSGKISIEIYDSSGKLISSQKITPKEEISTQALQTGIYLVKVSGLSSRLTYFSQLIVRK